MPGARAGGMLARAEIAGTRLSSLKRGQALTVSVADKTYRGTLQYISLELTSNGKYLLDVKFSTAGHLLRAGLTAHIELP